MTAPQDRLVKDVFSDLEYMAEDEGAGLTERDRVIADAAVRTTLTRLADAGPVAGRIRLLLAASPAAGEGLDVERLARALPAVFRYFLAGKRVAGLTITPETNPRVDRQWADAIAAEYARLAATTPDTEETRGRTPSG